MLNILIPTMPDDTHAIYVHLAMQQKGHNTLLWYTADFPTQQMHTFEINQRTTQWTAEGERFSIEDNLLRCYQTSNQ